MKKFIQTKLGAFLCSVILTIFLMSILFLFEVLDTNKLWVKMFCLIPSILLYNYLRSLKNTDN